MRCLDDLPKGCFICVYTGLLLSEDEANEDGFAQGDEYLAELDHIEVVERQKEEMKPDDEGIFEDSDIEDEQVRYSFANAATDCNILQSIVTFWTVLDIIETLIIILVLFLENTISLFLPGE